MDKEIVGLIVVIDDILSFVEDVDVLKDKLKHFTDTLEQILTTITTCGTCIERYLKANVAGISSDNTHLIILINKLRTRRSNVESV